MDASSPLSGIMLLDASRVLAGPFCGQLLGDLGAEVVKVERPGRGDETRAWGPPFVGELSSYFLACNRNKRSITLNLASADGVAIFHQLARRADVVLENFRAESAERLGLSPEKLLSVNPTLVICSISGFGRTGPMRELAGYDFAIQALCGLMQITGPVDGPPCKVGVAVTDVLTGLYAAVSILACLRARTQSGHGYHVDLALLDCAVAGQVNVVQAFLNSGKTPPRQGNAHLQIVPYQMFATADSWLVLAVGNDQQWNRFCRIAGIAELAVDAKFAVNAARVQNRAILVPIVAEALRKKTTAHWQHELDASGIPNAPVWGYEELFASGQMEARNMRIAVTDPKGKPVELVGAPFHIHGAKSSPASMPPLLGQHTDTILEEYLGMDKQAIEALRSKGVI